MAQVIINPHITRQTSPQLPPFDARIPQPDIVETDSGYGLVDDTFVVISTAADLLEEVAQPTRARWLADPQAWVEERLKGFIWSKQRDLLDSIRDNDQTAVHTCHNIGKSHAAALAAC